MVALNDVTLRDGHQSLLSGRLRQEHIDRLAPLLEGAGFAHYEVWGGTTYEIPIAFKGEDPWDNLDKIRAAMPTSNLSMLVRGQSAVSRSIQSDATVKLFIATAAKHGVNTFRIFDALNDFDNVKTALDAVHEAKQRGEKVSAQGTISYTDPVQLPDGKMIHTADDMVALAHRMVAEGHADSICIKDMAGLLKPDSARELITRLKRELPGTSIVLHMHATMGRSDAALKAAIEAGVDEIDTASAGLAYGSGQSATEDILAWLKKEHPDQAPAIDEAKLKQVHDMLREIRPCYAQNEAKYHPELEALLVNAQVPGGMLTTMEANIRSGLGKQANDEKMFNRVLRKTLEEMVPVRAEVGYPPLVTPTSQVVMTQAVYNAISMVRAEDKGEDANAARYAQMTPDFAQLAQGRFGKLRGPVKPELVAQANRQSVAPLPAGQRPADTVAIDLEAERQKLTQALRLSTPTCDEDLLTSVLFPKPGIEFLKHKHGIAAKQFEETMVLPSTPEPILLHGKPRIDAVAPLALPFVDALVHLSVEQAKLGKGGQNSFLGQQFAARAAEAKSGLIATLRDRGHFGAAQTFVLKQELDKCIATRGARFGLPASHLPQITLDDFKAAGMTTGQSMARATVA